MNYLQQGDIMISGTKIGLTGLPGVGKTRVLIKVCKMLEKEIKTVGGMISTQIEEDGEVVGWKCIDWASGEEAVFAHRDFESDKVVEEMGLHLEVLEEIGVGALQWAYENADIIVIDEVGKKEVESPMFVQAVQACMEAEKPLMVTLHKKSRNPLLQEIRRRDDIRILEVTYVNRNLLPYKMIKILRGELI